MRHTSICVELPEPMRSMAAAPFGNSTKNEKLIDLKPFGGAIEKPRTFTDQLRSVGATPIEHSDPDPQSPNSLIRFGRPKPQIVRDRLSECTKNNKNDQIEDDVDFYEGIDIP